MIMNELINALIKHGLLISPREVPRATGDRRSTTAVRRPARAMCHARSLPPTPLPKTRMSNRPNWTLPSAEQWGGGGAALQRRFRACEGCLVDCATGGEAVILVAGQYARIPRREFGRARMSTAVMLIETRTLHGEGE